MLEYCTPKCQSEIAKLKRVKSRTSWYKHSQETIDKIRKSNTGRKLTDNHKRKIGKSRLGKSSWIKGLTHSNETKEKLSKITKSQWKNGIHKPKYKSRGHSEIIQILSNLGYNVQDEFIVNGRPYDVYVEDKNLLIEFNGTFWHRDSRFDKYKNDPSSPGIWKNDFEKIDNAESRGYAVKVIWQYDWENCQDKEGMIKALLC